MTLRLLEIIIPQDAAHDLHQLLAKHETLGVWRSQLDHDHQALVRVLLPSFETEEISDAIRDQFTHHDGFRILFYAIEATIPQPEAVEENATEAETDDEIKLRIGRISREELYTDVAPGAMLSAIYVITVLLSTLVAAIGLLFDDVAIIIGAMVIAPLLRPNVALALAVALGDLDLAKKSIKANAVGIITAFLLSMLIGVSFTVDPDMAQIATRSSIRLGQVLLALSAGIAGALAFTTGVSVTLIGVMVAVALLPPLVASGLLAGAGYWSLAGRAFALFLINVTGVNLASVITFLAQGIRPRQWWEAEIAKRATRFAIVFWLLLLFSFLALVFWLKPQ